MAGVAFEWLDRLASPRSVAAMRTLGDAEARLAEQATTTLTALRKPDAALSGKLVDRARRAIGQRHKVPKDAAQLTSDVTAYVACFDHVEALRAGVADTLQRELADARRVLAEAAAGPLRRYSVFSSSSSVGERMASVDGGDGDSRGRRERAGDRLHLNYLQRVAAKNDTISEFGPTAWGRVDLAAHGLLLAPQPGLARRHAFLEKWVTTELCAVMTLDADARLEAIPRVEPLGRTDGHDFVRADLGVTRALTAEERALLGRIDGRTPAHALGDLATLERLCADGVVIWRFEAPILDAERARVVLDDVRAWRDGPARARWEPVLARLVDAPAKFAVGDTDARHALMAATGEEIIAVAGARKDRGRTLYAAANPIGEDCARDGEFTLGSDVAAQFLTDAAPWLDFFRDTAAHAWRHVRNRLADLFASAPTTNGAISLPLFMQHAEQSGVPLATDGVARLANEPFREIQVAFEQHLAGRADAPELELTADDYGFVRQRFDPPAATLWPCVDLQIAAASSDAVARGDYELVVGEVNSFCPVAAHVFFWGCPDKAAFAAELRAFAGVSRACHAYLGILDRGNHVAFHWPEIFGDQWTGVVRERVGAGRRSVAPGEATVVLRDGELRVLGPAGDDLGALVYEWDMPFELGIHPFMFRRGRHVPRLRSGKTILQRQQWTIAATELAGCPYSGVSPALLGAVDRLRKSRGLPRHIFVRPSEQALSERVSGLGRDKDVKPFYIDLESYLFCEAFDYRLAKYGELEVTEMLPGPDQLLWQEPEGRRTFEMRILCGPADRQGRRPTTRSVATRNTISPSTRCRSASSMIA